MDFQEQVSQALDRSTPIRRRPVIALVIIGCLALVIVGLLFSQRAIDSILSRGTERMGEKYDATAENLRKYELLSSTLCHFRPRASAHFNSQLARTDTCIEQ